MNEEQNDELMDAYYVRQRFYNAERALKEEFQRIGEVNLSVVSLTKESIHLDVEIKYHGEHGFSYYITYVAESHLRLWRNNEQIRPKLSLFAKSDIPISIKPHEAFHLSFVGYFKDHDASSTHNDICDFPGACIYTDIGNDFELEYSFLGKVSNRIRIHRIVE